MSRSRPSTTDIMHGESDLATELTNQTNALTTLASVTPQFNVSDNKLYIGGETDDSIIFYCGTATDI